MKLQREWTRGRRTICIYSVVEFTHDHQAVSFFPEGSRSVQVPLLPVAPVYSSAFLTLSRALN